MDQATFEIEMEKSFLRSKKLLNKKAKEYAQEGGDRLAQFYRAGLALNESPSDALMGMAMKHVTSIVDMCQDPLIFSLKKWNEKITDLRNYTILLDALVRDLGIS